MKTSTKLGIIGIFVGTVTSVVFGVIEIRDRRKGRRKMNKEDIEEIADQVVRKQKETLEDLFYGENLEELDN